MLNQLKIMQNFERVKVYIFIIMFTVFLIDHVKGFSIIESLSKAFDDPVSYVYTHNIVFYHVLFLKTHGQWSSLTYILKHDLWLCIGMLIKKVWRNQS